jgi:hypothetical protein
MKKLLSWGTCFFLLCGMVAISVSADELDPELLLAEGLNCPCKAETIAPPPPPPPPASPAKYYGGLEIFGLTKNLLEGGHNVTTKNNDGSVIFRDVDDATERFDFGGGRLTIGRMLDERDAVELTLMGFNHESSSFVSGTGGNGEDLFAAWDNTPGGFLPAGLFNDEFQLAEYQRVNSGTRMGSLEVNYRRLLTPIFSAFVGLRYAYLGDELLMLNDDSENDQVDATYDINGTNHLFGPQVGVDMTLPLTNKLGLNTGVKIGGFMNVAQIDTILQDNESNYALFKDDEIRGSLISEGNIAMSWNFTDNISASLGYMAMLMSFVTTAGEHFAQANTAAEFQKHASDHLLVHGPLARINIVLP